MNKERLFFQCTYNIVVFNFPEENDNSKVTEKKLILKPLKEISNKKMVKRLWTFSEWERKVDKEPRPDLVKF